MIEKPESVRHGKPRGWQVPHGSASRLFWTSLGKVPAVSARDGAGVTQRGAWGVLCSDTQLPGNLGPVLTDPAGPRTAVHLAGSCWGSEAEPPSSVSGVDVK